MREDAFLPLGDWLRERGKSGALVEPEVMAPAPAASSSVETPEILAFAEEASLLRLRLVESFERSRARLLRRFSDEVLGRELRLAPADVEELARKTLADFTRESSMSLVVSSADAAALRTELAVRVDDTLEPGDFLIDLAEGGFTSMLAFRVERALRETLDEEGAL